MKILTDRYPLGSLPRQRTAGRYIDATLYENIQLLAKNIIKDMTYLGVITSSTLEVGTGKSVFAQQFSEAYLESVREYHNIDHRLSMENLVFNPKDIIERSFKVPKRSVVICDEWDDSHYWSELGISLRQFFRKCRQLNLLILIIIPNFFQLPMSYAISRSVFLVDVRFSGEFDRGYFSFYNFQAKKRLYVHGKRQQNYNVVKSIFTGRFLDGYVVDEKEYRRAKLSDLIKQEKAEKKPHTEKQIKVQLFKQLNTNLEGVSIESLSKGFGISSRTAYRWLNEEEVSDNDSVTGSINYLMGEGTSSNQTDGQQ